MGIVGGVSRWLRIGRVAEAKARATTFVDWLAILRVLAERTSVDAAELADVAQRTLDAASTEGRADGFTDVARVRAKLGDRDGARAALEAGVRVLDGVPHPAWRVLARGFSETLADDEGARRCIDLGLAQARRSKDVDGMCVLARHLDESDNRAGAIALVAEAEALLGADARGVWSVASLWEELDKPEAAADVLQRALASARDTDAALHIGAYRRADRSQAHVALALLRARDVARSALDWFDVATRAHDGEPSDTSVIRAALDRAASLTEADILRRHVARAYVAWLGDVRAADALGPRGFRPDMLRMQRRRLPDEAPGSASALFDWLRGRLTPETLGEIAGADYGQDEEAHLAALVDLQTTGLLWFDGRSPTHMLPWHPREVAALTRWSRTADVARAWCCTLLWLCPGDDDPVDIAPGLVESCIALGDEAAALAAQLFVWHAETDERDLSGESETEHATADEGADAVALLALLLLRAAADPSDPRVPVLAKRVTEHPAYPPQTFLLESIQPELWLDLIERMLEPLRSRYTEVARLLAEMS